MVAPCIEFLDFMVRHRKESDVSTFKKYAPCLAFKKGTLNILAGPKTIISRVLAFMVLVMSRSSYESTYYPKADLQCLP